MHSDIRPRTFLPENSILVTEVFATRSVDVRSFCGEYISESHSKTNVRLWYMCGKGGNSGFIPKQSRNISPSGTVMEM